MTDEAGGNGAAPIIPAAPEGGIPWYAGLSKEQQETELVKNSDSVASVVDQALNAQSRLGDSIRIPGPEASEEARADFHKKLVDRVPGMYYMPEVGDVEARKALLTKLGAPESAEDYEFVAPEDASMDEGLRDNFRAWASELSLTKDQAAGLFDRYNTLQNQQNTAIQTEQDEGLARLKAEMGLTYEDEIGKIAHLVAQHEGTELLQQSLKDGRVPAHIIKMLKGFADGLMGKGFEMVEQPRAIPDAVVPSEALARAAEIRANPAFGDAGHQDNKRLVAEHFRYMSLANPDGDTRPPARAGFHSDRQ